MKVFCEQGKIHILIDSPLLSDKDRNVLLEYLSSQGHFSITCFETRTLSDGIIRRIYELQKEKRCAVYVLKKHLYAYLIRLGIKCSYTGSEEPDEPLFVDPRNSPIIEEDELKEFLCSVRRQYGYDFTAYHAGSICRRIELLMKRSHIAQFPQFQEKVIKEEEFFEVFFRNLFINTTEFFRDPHVFARIKNDIFPRLRKHGNIRIWCAGCSNGKEPYSLAMLLYEAGLLSHSLIYATDINPYMIDEAKNGLYPLTTFQADCSSYQAAGGMYDFKDYFEWEGEFKAVKPFLKKNILFFRHNLVQDNLNKEFHLILCRNVLIYFNNELQEQVLAKLNGALEDHGTLVLGKSERLLGSRGSLFRADVKDNVRFFEKADIQAAI